MRRCGKLGCICVALFAGCIPLQPLPDEPATLQVPSSPSPEPPQAIVRTKVNYAPASQESSIRVELVRGKLIGENPQFGIRPQVLTIGSPDPEIFHLGVTHVYLTEGLIRQCSREADLAAVLANELGRMVSQREAMVSDDIRKPERLAPIHLPIAGGGYAQEADPANAIELALYEKIFPRHPRKLARPDPQRVARKLLEHAGFQSTDLDAVQPILENAQRFSSLENQFKGTLKQSDWQRP